MRFERRKFRLKDGRNCVLRPAVPEDAVEMVDFLKQVSGESPFLLKYPEEWKLSEDKERELLQNLLDNEKDVMMVAEVDGTLAGNCSLNGLGGGRKVSHRCSLAIALKKAYWNFGIGRNMVEYLTELACQAGYGQIELEVVADNDSARALYAKCGFTEMGKCDRGMKYDDGSYRDLIWMGKRLG